MAAEFHKLFVEDTNDSKCFWGGGNSVFCLSMEIHGAHGSQTNGAGRGITDEVTVLPESSISRFQESTGKGETERLE